MSEQPVQAGEPVTIQPADQPQPPIQQPAQGDRNYVEGPDGAMTEQPAPGEGTSNESADPGPAEVLPDPSGQPPGAVVASPPPLAAPVSSRWPSSRPVAAT